MDKDVKKIEELKIDNLKEEGVPHIPTIDEIFESTIPIDTDEFIDFNRGASKKERDIESIFVVKKEAPNEEKPN